MTLVFEFWHREGRRRGKSRYTSRGRLDIEGRCKSWVDGGRDRRRWRRRRLHNPQLTSRYGHKRGVDPGSPARRARKGDLDPFVAWRNAESRYDSSRSELPDDRIIDCTRAAAHIDRIGICNRYKNPCRGRRFLDCCCRAWQEQSDRPQYRYRQKPQGNFKPKWSQCVDIHKTWNATTICRRL